MNKGKMQNYFDVLLVEDNDADILLLKEALEETKNDIHPHVIHNGMQAILYLRGNDPYTDAPRPDLIILDLNLPRYNGFKVLTEIKQNDSLRQIPVVVFSTSQAREEINQCYQLNANCFITKPSNLDDFFEVVKKICDFWFSTVQLPD
jgi:chemotaxis family two-component system response regulator Rcp1